MKSVIKTFTGWVPEGETNFVTMKYVRDGCCPYDRTHEAREVDDGKPRKVRVIITVEDAP